jgi:predicted ATP-grasp superfamily ATP-dependent carboligase
LNAQIELAAHHNRVRLSGELVEEVEGDGVDFIVDVETAVTVSVNPRRHALNDRTGQVLFTI